MLFLLFYMCVRLRHMALLFGAWHSFLCFCDCYVDNVTGFRLFTPPLLALFTLTFGRQ